MFTVDRRGLASQHFFLNLVLLYVVEVQRFFFWFVFGEVPRSSFWKIRYHLNLKLCGFFVPHKMWTTQNSHQFRLRWGWNWSKHKVPWRCLSITGWTEPIDPWFFPVLVDTTPEGYSDLKPMNFNYQPSKIGRGPYISNMSRWKRRAIANILSQPQIGLRACPCLEQ